MASSFISCGTLSLEMLCPFIAPIFCFIDSLCLTSLSPKWKKHTTLKVFCLSLGQLLSGIILQLIQFLMTVSAQSSKRHTFNNNRHRNKISIISPDYIHTKTTKYFVLIIPAVFYLLSMFSVYFASEFFSYQITKLTAIIVQIIFASIVCWIGLSLYLYKHHFWSFSVIIMGYIIVLAINYSFFVKNCTSNSIVLHLTVNFLAYIFFTIEEFFEKLFMNKYYITPPLILLIEGAFNTIVMSSLIGILHLIPCDGYWLKWQYCDPNYQKDHIESFTYLTELFNDEYNGWFFIGLIVSSGGFNTMVKYTVYKYSPIHRCVSDLLSCIFSVFYFELPSNGVSFTGLRTSQIIIMMTGYGIILLSCLVYNEFIILGCCGLSENTKKMIIARTVNEVKTYAYDIDLLLKMNNEMIAESDE